MEGEKTSTAGATLLLGVGRIVWLLSREDDNKSIKCIREFCSSNRELSEGGYNYPVVVIKVNPNSFGDIVCSITQVSYLHFL